MTYRRGPNCDRAREFALISHCHTTMLKEIGVSEGRNQVKFLFGVVVVALAVVGLASGCGGGRSAMPPPETVIVYESSSTSTTEVPATTSTEAAPAPQQAAPPPPAPAPKIDYGSQWQSISSPVKSAANTFANVLSGPLLSPSEMAAAAAPFIGALQSRDDQALRMQWPSATRGYIDSLVNADAQLIAALRDAGFQGLTASISQRLSVAIGQNNAASNQVRASLGLS